jgi:hypothetical protein
VAGLAVTHAVAPDIDVADLADAVRRAASHLTQRLGGHG